MGSGESCWGHRPQSAQTSLSLLTLTLTLLLVVFSRSPRQQPKVTSRQLESVHQGLPSVLMNSGAAM